MFLVVPFLGVVAATWRIVLHLFDPEGTALAAGSEWPPVRAGPETARAPTVPPGAQAEPSTTP
jgi:hypothetical protein